jgi:hypothetical protein
MRGNHVLFDERLEGCSYQCTSRGNQTVHEDGEPVTGAAEDETGNASYFQTANRREPAERLVNVRGVELYGTLNHVDFVLPGRLVNTGPIPRDLLDRRARKQRYQSTAGRSIANTHVPCGHQRDPITRALLSHLDTNF